MVIFSSVLFDVYFDPVACRGFSLGGVLLSAGARVEVVLERLIGPAGTLHFFRQRVEFDFEKIEGRAVVLDTE